MEELFEHVQREVRKSAWADRIPAGVVLTGGAVNLEGTAMLAEEVLDMPVRIGYPMGVVGLTETIQDPRFATGVGLVLHGAERAHAAERRNGRPADGAWERAVDRVRAWLGEF